MDSLERVKETAAQWVARKHGAQWSPDDEATLQRWLDASFGHRVEYLGYEKTWREARRLKVLGAGAEPGAIPKVDPWRASPYFKHLRRNDGNEVQTNKTRTVRLRIFGLAAAVLVVCAAGYHALNPARGERYTTSIGVTTAVPLSDGSKIILNTASEIRVALNEAERRIDLDHGEAFFEVAKDPRRPFTVVAGDKHIVAVGTKFSVRRDADDVHVIVTEGKVRVRSSAQQEVLLTAGNIAATRDEKIAVRQQSLPQTEELLSWREGYLMFDEVDLAEAVAEFNRYNVQKFVIQDLAIASIPVTGHFRSTSIEPFARLLEQGFPVTVTREKDRIVLGSPDAK